MQSSPLIIKDCPYCKQDDDDWLSHVVCSKYDLEQCFENMHVCCLNVCKSVIIRISRVLLWSVNRRQDEGWKRSHQVEEYG